MSKTIGSILTIAGSAALVATGIGAAAGLAIFGTTAGITVAGATLGELLIASSVLTAVGGIFTQLGTQAPRPPQTEGALKQSTPARQSGYGRNRLHMAYALFATANDGTAVDVGVFHDGKIDGVEGHYLGDTKIVLLPDGRVQAGKDGQFGELSDIVKIFYRLGNAIETAFSQVVAKLPDQWTSDHRGDGCVTSCVLSAPVKSKNYQMIYPTGGPNQMPHSMVMRLQLCFDWRDPSQSIDNPATWKWTENAILHLAHYELTRDNKDWDVHFAPTLAYWTAAANVCDQGVSLKGVQTILVEDADAGSGHITVTSTNGLTSGMTIVLSATGDTSLTETRTVTTIVAGNGGFVLGLNDDLDNDHPSGSQVTWASSSGSPATEPRYRTCVVHQHTDPHKAVVNSLLACCDGWMAPRADGALVVYAGEYHEPTVTIGPDQVVSYSLQDGLGDETAVNSLSITYVSANHNFNVVDTDAWTDEDDISARGQILSDQLANQVPSFSQARRLGKAAMARRNAPKRGSASTNSGGRAVLGQRYIRLVLEDAGTTFLDDVVEIQAPVKRNPTTGGISFSWVLADPNAYAWNPATEDGLPAPVGNRVASQPLAAPSITSAVTDFSSISDDGTGVRVTINATGPDRADLTWFARWRVVGDPSWNEAQYNDTDPGADVTLQTAFVPTGQPVEVEVAYQVGDGRVSPYSSPATEVDTSTDTTPPDAATAVTVVSWVDALNLSTDAIPRASTYRWRIYADDGTTLIRDMTTPSRTVSYTASQALVDGVRRSYVVTVAGVNAAGAGTEASSGVITNAPPSLVTGFSATGGTSNAEVDFDLLAEGDVAGYAIYVASVADFDPVTQGQVFKSLGSPAYLQNLAAGTFYVKMAAYDAWSDFPGLLNVTSETSFAITTGGGGTGGGGGGGGGGWCCEWTTPILMANESGDGPGIEKMQKDAVVGDLIWTRPDLDDGTIGEWGAYEIEAIDFVEADLLKADIGITVTRATATHPMWLSGWVEMGAIGSPDGRGIVAKISVKDAHTFYGNGILHHNKLANPDV